MKRRTFLDRLFAFGLGGAAYLAPRPGGSTDATFSAPRPVGPTDYCRYYPPPGEQRYGYTEFRRRVVAHGPLRARVARRGVLPMEVEYFIRDAWALGENPKNVCIRHFYS